MEDSGLKRIVEDCFSDEITMRRAFETYTKREGQILLATAIAESINNHHLVAEGPTGVGKGLSYLVPIALAIEYGIINRAIVSTANIALQEQLINKDIPAINRLFPTSTITAAVLKGLNNYLCKRKFYGLVGNRRDVGTEERKELEHVEKWTQLTVSGDKSELDNEISIWYQISSTSDECPGKSCPYYKECYGRSCRERAMRSQIVVTNYNLLLLGQKLLPPYQLLICDEAHALPDVARCAFGWELTKRSVEWASNKAGSIGLSTLRNTISECADTVFDHMENLLRQDNYYVLNRRNVPESVLDLMESIRTVKSRIEVEIERLKEKEDYVSKSKLSDLNVDYKRCDSIITRLKNLSECRLSDVIWLENEDSIRIKSRPIEVGDSLNSLLYSNVITVLLSATMKTDSSFDYIMRELGVNVPNVKTCSVSSPFDYRKQGTLMVPSDLPRLPSRLSNKTNWEEYYSDISDILISFIKMCGGKVLALFTSWNSLKNVGEKLIDRGIVGIYSQNDAPRSLLIEQFGKSERGILMGVASFWEGIDVPGMSGLWIEKIPFPVPNDPVFQARSTRLENVGRNGFREISIPTAILKLKQGTGRLIRTSECSGNILIADRRIHEKQYGDIIMKSLPPFYKTKKSLKCL